MGKKCTGEQKATRLGVSRHKKRTSKTRVIQREGAKHKIQSRYPALEQGKRRGKPKETMDMLNSWKFLLSSLKDLSGHVPSPFDDLSSDFKLIALFFTTQGITLGVSLFSLVFRTLRACYFPAMKSLGLIPEGLLPPIAWQLMFFPFE